MRRILLLLALCGCSADAISGQPELAKVTGTIIFDGNSLTSPLHGHTPYPNFVIQELRTPAGLLVVNTAVPGQTTADMIMRGPSVVDVLHASRGVNIVVMWEGTNDLYFGATPQIAYQHLVEYALARKRAGWKVVVLTLMPRTGVNTRKDFEVVRQSLNAMIRANWRTFSDQLADVALDPRFGAPDAELNPRYFEDGTHLTQYGIEHMAHLATPAIERLLH
jgi:lysophospholipase L1-like esterase